MKPFTVKKLPPGRGLDKDALYAVTAVGTPELVKTGESPSCAHITAFSRNARTEAARLCDHLNEAFRLWHEGKVDPR